MPEGDTLHRTARVLARGLAGQRILRAEVDVERWAFGPALLEGRVVSSVEARGKNLLLHLDDGHLVWSHFRMTGSFHLYRPGEPWTRPVRQRTLALYVEHAVAVGFNLPVLERLSTQQAQRHPQLAQLGPDLLSPAFDVAAAVARFRAEPLLSLGEALLDQRLAAGVGNVYKSEVLHLCGMDPFSTVSTATDAQLSELLRRARALMLRNLDGRMRRTAHGPSGQRYHAYGREGLPCATCDTPIEMARQGAAGRSTYFCPTCQRTRVRGRAHTHPYRRGC
jgi:endonuclease-8